MLRITTINTLAHRKLVVEGKLVGPWVAELRKAWQEAMHALDGQKLVIDLGNVTVISPQAECTLLEIMREGTEVVCCGILNRHLVRQIERRCKQANNN